MSIHLVMAIPITTTFYQNIIRMVKGLDTENSIAMVGFMYLMALSI